MKREAMYLKKDQGGAWKEDREREIDVIILWSEKIKEIIILCFFLIFDQELTKLPGLALNSFSNLDRP